MLVNALVNPRHVFGRLAAAGGMHPYSAEEVLNSGCWDLGFWCQLCIHVAADSWCVGCARLMPCVAALWYI